MWVRNCVHGACEHTLIDGIIDQLLKSSGGGWGNERCSVAWFQAFISFFKATNRQPKWVTEVTTSHFPISISTLIAHPPPSPPPITNHPHHPHPLTFYVRLQALPITPSPLIHPSSTPHHHHPISSSPPLTSPPPHVLRYGSRLSPHPRPHHHHPHHHHPPCPLHHPPISPNLTSSGTAPGSLR